MWCLLISQVPFLYSLFDWKLVAPERQAQLRQATEVQIQLANRAYQEMQQRYKVTRQLLFQFMTECADIERIFQRSREAASLQLDGQVFLAFEALIERGRGLYCDAAAHARKMLQDQGELPIIDVVRVDANQTAVEAFSMPLLPIVSEEEAGALSSIDVSWPTGTLNSRSFGARCTREPTAKTRGRGAGGASSYEGGRSHAALLDSRPSQWRKGCAR